MGGGGGGDKTTIMVLKVDLQCCSCYKKVQKILCKFPQIRNQEYDEKSNTVTISVVCCDPEKLRDKLCCKGCGVIKSIEIKEPKKTPPEPTKSKPPKKPGKTPPPPSEPKCTMPTSIQVYLQLPPGSCCGQCYEGHTKGKTPTCQLPPPPDQKCTMPIQKCPQPPPGDCCGQCSEGRPGGPCYQLCYGRPVPPLPCYSYYGHRKVCCVSTYDHYFCDENATGCSIM